MEGEAAGSGVPSTSAPAAATVDDVHAVFDDVEVECKALRGAALALQQRRADLRRRANTAAPPPGCSETDAADLHARRVAVLRQLDCVKVECETPRTPSQMDSLHAAVEYVSQTSQALQAWSGGGSRPPDAAASVTELHTRATALMNACLPETSGPVDHKFEGMLAGCALDDRKLLRAMTTELFSRADAAVAAHSDGR